MTGFGMAEFSNINFVSAGTNFTALASGATAAQFPRPILDLGDVSTSVPTDACKDGTQVPGGAGSPLMFYGNTLTDPAPGALLHNPRMTTHSIFDQHLADRGLPPVFALNCFNLDAAAAILLPRAAAYSAALIQYFFRGRLEIAPPDRFAYSLAAFQPGNTGAFTTLRFKVRSATPDEDVGPGRMTAVVRYRTAGENLIENPFADLSEPRYAVSQGIPLGGLALEFQEFVFDFSQSPIPANSADLFLTVVYRGSLGLEDDAVLVGGKDLFEPDPVDLANISDWECVGGTLYPVSDSIAYPPYLPPGQTQRDVNHDGVQDLFGPLLPRNLFLKTFDLLQPPPILSENSFDFRMAQESFAQYGRLMLLQDQSSYGAAMLAREIVELPSGFVHTNLFLASQLRGVFNDVVRGPTGQRVRRVLASGRYRGVATHHVTVIALASILPCFAQTPFLAPDLTRIEGIVAAP